MFPLRNKKKKKMRGFFFLIIRGVTVNIARSSADVDSSVVSSDALDLISVRSQSDCPFFNACVTIDSNKRRRQRGRGAVGGSKNNIAVNRVNSNRSLEIVAFAFVSPGKRAINRREGEDCVDGRSEVDHGSIAGKSGRRHGGRSSDANDPVDRARIGVDLQHLAAVEGAVELFREAVKCAGSVDGAAGRCGLPLERSGSGVDGVDVSRRDDDERSALARRDKERIARDEVADGVVPGLRAVAGEREGTDGSGVRVRDGDDAVERGDRERRGGDPITVARESVVDCARGKIDVEERALR